MGVWLTEQPQQRCLPAVSTLKHALQNRDRGTHLCFTAQTQALAPALSYQTPTPASVRETQISLRSLTSATQGPTLTSLSRSPHPHLLPHKGKARENSCLFTPTENHNFSLTLSTYGKVTPLKVFPTSVKRLKINLSKNVCRPSTRFH